MFPEEAFEVQGIPAPSEVFDQPMSGEETLKSATKVRREQEISCIKTR